MRVLVDTSAWVDYFNGSPSLERQAVAKLFSDGHQICTCGVIVAEVFQGFRKDKRVDRLAELFRDLTLLEPAGLDFYFKTADLYRSLRQRGKTIRSTIDCMIAVLAEEHSCAVLARDRDVDTILDSGLLNVSRWTMDSSSS